MNAQQNKVADDAITQMSKLRSQIASRSGDLKSLTKEYNDLVAKTKASLNDVVLPLKDANKKYWEKHNKINIRNIPVCGTLERQPDFSASDVIAANAEADVIRNIVKADPINYADLEEMTNESMRGSGAGNYAHEVTPPNLGAPKWIKELTTDLRIFKGRTRIKEDYDFESMVRGLPRKQKAKKQRTEKSLFICIDTSGSMSGRTSRGYTILELVAGYIVPIAKKFLGELWNVDDGAPSHKTPLKEIRKEAVKKMGENARLTFVGGGGTNFDQCFRELAERREELQEKQGKNVEFMTIFLTDADATWNEKLLPNNLIIVTIPQGVHYLPYLDPKKNQRAIVAQLDTPKGQ